MTNPSIDRAAAAVGELSASVRLLTDEVKAAEALREDKVRWLQRSITVAGIAIVLLIGLVIANFALLSSTKDAAQTSASTNSLLLGCFRPHTTCSDVNTQKTTQLFDTIRQTQFVISVCQRQNPLPPNPSQDQVDAGTKALQACVQEYYPGFKLPTKAAKPSPKASSAP